MTVTGPLVFGSVGLVIGVAFAIAAATLSIRHHGLGNQQWAPRAKGLTIVACVVLGATLAITGFWLYAL
ncbi:hypothetical protein [Schumannella sp. 10F1B-5-1]|uniref:hypothetical protein n=1 Tax=Schumannella sp. 10F1B-5-1 TaxID=2590780 RepID=UPI001132720D|nr:hypothetical protein [Schumannella sp. 10F1B-5-1]TPW78361.1 hypothetical protein FJ658_00710 [Schumannella sp. 10F1B-5-1]